MKLRRPSRQTKAVTDPSELPLALQKEATRQGLAGKPPGVLTNVFDPPECGSPAPMAWAIRSACAQSIPLRVHETAVVPDHERHIFSDNEALRAKKDLKQKDGTVNRLYEYWMLGGAAKPRGHRWSIIRNVLGWID